MLSTMNLSVSALGAFGVGMDVTANNIANINTDNFKASKVYYETGPDGHGTRVGDISRDLSAGSPIPGHVSNIGVSDDYALRESSNVSPEREFTNMISLGYGYAANAQVVRSMEDTTGMILDMKV